VPAPAQRRRSVPAGASGQLTVGSFTDTGAGPWTATVNFADVMDMWDISPDPDFTKIMLGDGNSILVRIPPGVAHGCRNLGDEPARIIYMVDEQFSAEPGSTDEGRLPWDLVGAEIWEPTKD